MPKKKTHKGTAKRVRVTGTGKLRARAREQPAQVRGEVLLAQAPGRAAPACSSAGRRSPHEEAARVSDRPPPDEQNRSYSRGTREAGGQRPEEAPDAPSRRPAATAASVRGCTARPRSSCSTRPPTTTATARPARVTSASCGSPGSTPRPAQNDMTYNRFMQGLQAGRHRAGPQASWPSSPSTSRPPSPRWSRPPAPPSPPLRRPATDAA